MFRSLTIALSLAASLIVAIPTGWAATPAAPAQPAAPTNIVPPKPAAAPPLTPAQIDATVAMLKNPAQRNALIGTLEAMKANQATQKKQTTPAAIGLGLIQTAEVRASAVLADAGATLTEATDVSLIWHWLVFVATDSWLRHTVAKAALRLALVLATALAAERLVLLALRRPCRAIAWRAGPPRPAGVMDDAEGIAAAEAGETERVPRRRLSFRQWFRRLAFATPHLLLRLVPVLVVALVGFVWISTPFVANERVAKLVVVAVLNAYLVCRLVLEAARFLFSPLAPSIRLVRVSDFQARWLVIWLRRLVGTIAFGYAAIATGGLFGLYAAASHVLIKLISLVVHIMAAIMVLQSRRRVAAIIRGDERRSGTVVGAMRAGLARSWHVLALFYIIALWVAWAIGVPHAFFIMLRIVLVFALIGALARGIARLAGHSLDTLFDDGVAWRARYPALHARTRMYLPAIKLALASIIGVAAMLIILQLWGVGVLTWFTVTTIGQRIFSAAITIGAVVLIALVVWEATNAGMEGHADRLVRQGRAGRAARYRTLLPMLRSTLLVVILMIAGLVVLSAVGVNVTLLLGGLSIFGLAVGFGSQKLVQDIITGLFLLLEDAMQVGDWVTLGGISGSVEKLSIRTIRLRGGDGSLNIIPFSSVTTVANTSRDFGYAPLNLGIGYKEDVDRVQAIIREIFDSMKNEPEWAAKMYGDLELWGLDQFGASSLTIAGRVKTAAGQQYAVKREFNRRVKIRFDAENIELPYNYQKITIDPAEFREAFGRPAKPSSAEGEKPEGGTNG
ncbi:MAG: mechanosensitive ion channel family protein [Acidiphilium sp.]